MSMFAAMSICMGFRVCDRALMLTNVERLRCFQVEPGADIK